MEIIGKKCEVKFYYGGTNQIVYKGKILKVFESGNILILSEENYLKIFVSNENYNSDYSIKVLDME